jgi:hypothetical protein
MDNKVISSWVRQARYRANKRNIYNDLQILDVREIIDEFDGKCAYCDPAKACWGREADALDHPFPLSENTPNVPANVLPCCKEIKNIKKNNDLAWLFMVGIIKQDKYLKLLRSMLGRRGGDKVRQHLKAITGIQDDNQDK